MLSQLYRIITDWLGGTTTTAKVNLIAQPGVDIGDVTVNNAAGAAAVNIQDGGNSVTVDGTFWQATQPVSAATLPLPSGAATAALQLPDSHNVTVDNAAGAAAVNVQDGGNSLTVDGTFWQATQPVSAASLPLPTGAATAALQLPDSHNVTVDNAVGAAAVNIQDGGNAITVDGTVTAAAQPGVDIGDVTINNAAGASAVNVQDGGNALTTDWAGTAPPIGAGLEATALRVTVASDSTGTLTVDGTVSIGAFPASFLDGTAPGYVVTNIQGFSHTRNAAFVAAAAIGGELDDTTPVAATEGNVSPVRITAQRAVHVNLRDNAGSEITTLPVSGTFWQATQPVSQATAANLNAEVQGDAAHDAAASGNPVLVGAYAEVSEDTAPGNRASADGDVARLAVNRDGALYVAGPGPQIWSYHEDSSSALTDAVVHAAPGAGLSLYVTNIVCSTGAATAFNIFFEEGAAKVLGPYYLEAIAGRGLALHFVTPKKITANTALTVTTSAAIAHSVDITGFIAAG